MSKLIILSTPSAVLKIQMKTSGCSMKISKKRHFLMIKQKEEKPFNEVGLELRNDLTETIITSINVPSTTSEPEQRVRIDSLFSLVFQNAENISYSENFDACNFPSKVNEFSLNITVHLGNGIAKPTIAVVYSGSLRVESTVVPVSKEILAISSDYFTSFFFGNDREKDSGINTVDKFSVDDFVTFINIMHKRKFELSSVEFALVALGFADYFGMVGVIERTVQFLLNNDLSDAACQNRSRNHLRGGEELLSLSSLPLIFSSF